MSHSLITALDVGTSTIQTVIAERKNGEGLRILGIGVAPSSGVRKGVVTDIAEATAAIRRSVTEAERRAGVQAKFCWAAVGGVQTSVASSKGIVAVSRADGEISSEDVRRVLAAAESFVARNPNREILHIIPRSYRVDDVPDVRDPVGMHGVRLEVETLIIETSISSLKNLLKCIEGAGLRVEDYIFSPLAASYAVLSKRQKELGALLLDMGGGITHFMIFEEGVPLHAGVLPIGGNLITNDVAIGFQTHIDIAERIKLAYGSCLPGDIGKRDQVRLAEFLPEETAVRGRRELAEIIQARLRDIFELLQKELKKIDRKQLLPGGVVLVGGSSGLPGIIELTRAEMLLPAEFGAPEIIGFHDAQTSSSFATVLGVLKWTEMRMEESDAAWTGRLSRLTQSTWMRWLKSLLP